MSVSALSRQESRAALWPRQLILAALAVAAVAALVALASLLVGQAVPMPRAPHPFAFGMHEGGASATGLAGLLLAWQSAFFGWLRGALSALRDGGSGLPLLVGIGFAYGVFHAAGPGHGKAVIAAYIVSSERALVRGVAVSVAAALVQAAVAIALVATVFIAIGGTAATMSRTANVTELAGFTLVALLGLGLVWRKAGKLLALISPGSADHAGLCGCAPRAPDDGSWSHMAAVALGAGIRPCAGAIVALTLARSYGMVWTGILAVLAMALGTALTTGALAATAVYAKRLALRLASGRGRRALFAAAAAELAAAALVVVIGLALMAGLWGNSAGA